MELEYDPHQSEANRIKHGTDFEAAQDLWRDRDRIVIPARDLTELRLLSIGKIGKKYWSAIYTIRNDKIRLISVRKARQNEKEIYES